MVSFTSPHLDGAYRLSGEALMSMTDLMVDSMLEEPDRHPVSECPDHPDVDCSCLEVEEFHKSIARLNLDPGITKVVTFLRQKGFETTDSGDGVTKRAAGDEEALDLPHVAVRVPEELGLTRAADNLLTFFSVHGVPIDEQGKWDIWIEASYDPANRIGILVLFGLDDTKLAKYLEGVKSTVKV
jgi:hypothetical protein